MASVSCFRRGIPLPALPGSAFCCGPRSSSSCAAAAPPASLALARLPRSSRSRSSASAPAGLPSTTESRMRSRSSPNLRRRSEGVAPRMGKAGRRASWAPAAMREAVGRRVRRALCGRDATRVEEGVQLAQLLARAPATARLPGGGGTRLRDRLPPPPRARRVLPHPRAPIRWPHAARVASAHEVLNIAVERVRTVGGVHRELLELAVERALLRPPAAARCRIGSRQLVLVKGRRCDLLLPLTHRLRRVSGVPGLARNGQRAFPAAHVRRAFPASSRRVALRRPRVARLAVMHHSMESSTRVGAARREP